MTSVSLVTNGDTPLDEVQDSFYIFLQASLDQARAEGLLDVEVLSSAEGDLIIKGVSFSRSFFSSFSIVPRLALCLCLAAHAARPTPPRRRRCEVRPAPNALAHQLSLYIRAPHEMPVRVRALLHAICGLGQPTSPPAVTNLSEKLRSIAIEISQRQSFQVRVKSTFVSPPPYTHPMPPSAFSNTRESATITGPTDPAIELIRETLYAALAHVLESTPHLHAPLALDPPRAYFGSVALTILDVSTRSSAADEMDGGVVWLVRDRRLTIAECPDM